MTTLASNPKLAWALATDTSVRCAPGPWDDAVTGGRCIMTSLEHKAEYARIFGLIQKMERTNPGLAAVGHALWNASTEQCSRWIDDAADTALGVVASLIPDWGDGKAWRKTKKERAYYLIKVAIMERNENLSGERPAWGPERIKAVMESWYGMSLAVSQWQRDWMPLWSVIESALDRLEEEVIRPIDDELRAIRRQQMQGEAA